MRCSDRLDGLDAISPSFVWYGIKFVQFGWNQTSELADMPMTYIFISGR